MNGRLPTYEIIGVRPDSSTRLIADAEGIEAARLAVTTLLREGEPGPLEIVLDGRSVEEGRLVPLYPNDVTVVWQTVGRARDLR